MNYGWAVMHYSIIWPVDILTMTVPCTALTSGLRKVTVKQSIDGAGVSAQ